MRQVIAAVLVLGISSPAFADIRASLNRESALAAQQAARALMVQARPNAKGENKGLGLALIGGGITLMALGLVAGGTECPIGQFGPVCTTTSNKGLMLAGAGMAGVGGFLLYKGRAKSNPQILAGPHVIALRQQLVW